MPTRGCWGKWEAPHIWRTDADNGFGLIPGWREIPAANSSRCALPPPAGLGEAAAASCCPWAHLGQANPWNFSGFGELVLHLPPRKGLDSPAFSPGVRELCRNSVRVLGKVSWRPAQEDAQTQMFPGDGGMSIPSRDRPLELLLGSFWERFPEGLNAGHRILEWSGLEGP